MSFAILLLLVLMHLLLLRANKETDFLPGVPANSQRRKYIENLIGVIARFARS